MEARYVPFNYCVDWIKCSHAIGKRYYSLFLACGVAVLFTTIAISFVPFLGPVVVPCLSLFYIVGQLRFINQIRATGRGTFDDFLKLVFDPETARKGLPFLIILVNLGILSTAVNLARMYWLVYLTSLVLNVTLTVCGFATYMMRQNPAVTWQEAIKTILQGLWQNIFTWFVGAILVAMFGAVCLMLCLLPFVFYFIPVMFPYTYVFYSSIYEGLDVEQTIAEWSSKAQEVRTIDVPHDSL